jgi:hypothetical protein
VIAQCGAVVEHRIHHHLRPQCDALVVRALGHRGRQATPGAGSGDRDPVRVDAELVGGVPHPVQRRHAVVQGGRIPMFGRQSVIGGDHHGVELACHLPAADGLGLGEPMIIPPPWM